MGFTDLALEDRELGADDGLAVLKSFCDTANGTGGHGVDRSSTGKVRSRVGWGNSILALQPGECRCTSPARLRR